jgi:predicted nucleic acid-binding protein
VTLVDTNVILDLVTNDPVWSGWSLRELELAAARDEIAINDIVYAELSIGFPSIEQLDSVLAIAGLVMAPIPRPALFLAGKTFQRYRRAGGTRTGVLADFFLGAHAVIEDAPLITRDTARYRSYFPGIAAARPLDHNPGPAGWYFKISPVVPAYAEEQKERLSDAATIQQSGRRLRRRRGCCRRRPSPGIARRASCAFCSRGGSAASSAAQQRITGLVADLFSRVVGRRKSTNMANP